MFYLGKVLSQKIAKKVFEAVKGDARLVALQLLMETSRKAKYLEYPRTYKNIQNNQELLMGPSRKENYQEYPRTYKNIQNIQELLMGASRKEKYLEYPRTQGNYKIRDNII